MMGSYGVSEEQARFLVGILHASRAGEFGVVDPALCRRLQREPTPLRTVPAEAPTGQ
ncbi:hypothetical protein ACWCQW_55515 [Streptomyces mirabilis]